MAKTYAALIVIAFLTDMYINSATLNSTDMKLNAGIITTKLQETKQFYLHTLNFTVKFENEWFILLQTPNGNDQLAFMQPDHPSQQKIFQSAFSGKGVFITIEVDDADAEFKRIKKSGIPVEVELRDEPWGDRHFAIVDPNGIGVDIVKYTAPQ